MGTGLDYIWRFNLIASLYNRGVFFNIAIKFNCFWKIMKENLREALV